MLGKSNVNSALGFPYSHLLSLQANDLKRKHQKMLLIIIPFNRNLSLQCVERALGHALLDVEIKTYKLSITISNDLLTPVITK